MQAKPQAMDFSKFELEWGVNIKEHKKVENAIPYFQVIQRGDTFLIIWEMEILVTDKQVYKIK